MDGYEAATETEKFNKVLFVKITPR